MARKRKTADALVDVQRLTARLGGVIRFAEKGQFSAAATWALRKGMLRHRTLFAGEDRREALCLLWQCSTSSAKNLFAIEDVV